MWAGQRVKLSVLNAQEWGKELISQCWTVKGAKQSAPNTQSCAIRQQRLTAGVDWQANHLEEPPELSRDQERHKGWERKWRNKLNSQRSRQHSAQIRNTKTETGGGMKGQPPKAGQEVDPRANPCDRGQHSKLNYPKLLGEVLTRQNCNWRTTQLLPAENNCMNWQSYLTSHFQLILWIESPNTTHKPVTW
jgi:hypothetical protein